MAGVGQVLLAAVLFGASVPASKWLLAELPPLTLAGLLYLGAALGVAPGVWREPRRLRSVPAVGAVRAVEAVRAAPDRRGRRMLAGVVLFGGILGPVLVLLALRRADAAAVSLLLNFELVATAVLGMALFREPLGRRGLLGVAAAVAAGLLLGGWGGSGDSGGAGATASLLAVAACLCWGLDNHWSALIESMTPGRITLWKGAAAGTTNLMLGLWLEPATFAPGAIAAALVVGALGYGASVALYIRGARELGPTRAQGLFATAPFLGALLAFVALGDPFGPGTAVAGVLLAAAVFALTTDVHAHEHHHDAAEHTHEHRHDDGHHDHVHPGLPAWTRHTHWHRHAPVTHRHEHRPDLHHRHEH